jgi:hypothetical protein
MGNVSRSVRVVFLGVGALLLVASGCGFSDVLEWSGAPSVQTADSTPAAATVTATPLRSTPIPTATMWSYSTATPTPFDDTLYVTRTPRPTATPTPTPSPTPTSSPTPTPSPTPVVSLLPALPTEEDLPNGLRLEREVAHLDTADIAREAEDSAAYERQLRDWGYTRGAAREFLLPNPGVVDFLTKMLGFDARVLEFGSAASATNAIEFQRDFALSRPDWRLNETSVERIGDATIALTGTADYQGMEVRVAAIFVRDGDLVYRFVAVSGGYDAFDDAVAIARRVVERN